MSHVGCLYSSGKYAVPLGREATTKAAGLAILVMGLAIGAGLTFTLSFAYGVISIHTVTTTYIETSIVVITVPTFISTTTTASPRIQVSAASCEWGGAHEYCDVVLSNPGNLGTATTGNCSLTFGGQTYAGYTGPSEGSAVSPGYSQQLVPGGSPTVYCQASAGGAAGGGAQVTGSILLATGGDVPFNATASS